jgi:hypothetical protein
VELTQCGANLKSLGLALEVYATKHEGRYPHTLEELVPKPLARLPLCPAAGEMSYKLQTGPDVPTNENRFVDYYLLRCDGGHHQAAGVVGEVPAYDAQLGLLLDQAAFDVAVRNAAAAAPRAGASKSP